MLRRKLRTNAGQQHAISAAVRRVVIAQYAAHKSWSIKLHHDNLVALAETRPELKPVPSYPTLRRFMRANGLDKRRRLSPRRTEGAERAETRIVEREVRRYEAEYVNGLWHWDCHHGSRKVLTPRGEWVTPILFGVLDDRSRLACHLQWYLAETAEVIAHGLAQAFQKRGLPRAALSDNGSAMTAAEIKRLRWRSWTYCLPRRSRRRWPPRAASGRDEGNSAGAEPRKAAGGRTRGVRVPVPIPTRCREVGNGNWEVSACSPLPAASSRPPTATSSPSADQADTLVEGGGPDPAFCASWRDAPADEVKWRD